LGAGFGVMFSTGEGEVFVGRSGTLENVIAIESFSSADRQKLYDAVAKSLQ
jgi:hypothetical protein